MSKLLKHHLSEIKKSPKYCLGVLLDKSSDFNLVLSQMFKAQLLFKPSYFYLHSDSKKVIDFFKKVYSNEILTRSNFNEDISNLLSIFITTPNLSESSILKGKELLICNEDSYSFNFKESDISNFI